MVDRKRIKQLVAQLQSESAKERYVAVVELGRTKQTALIPHLDKVATLDDNPKVRKVAYQATQFLKKIKAEEDRQRHLAQLQALDSEDDAAVGETSLFSEPLYEDPDQRPEVESTWSYQQTLKSKDEAATARKAARERAAKRKRRRRRLRLIFLLAVATLALAVVASLVVNEEENDDPQSREEVIDGLEDWNNDVALTIGVYNTALATDPFDCGQFRDDPDADVPERPDWAGPDKAYQEDLEAYFEQMDTVRENLTEARRRIDLHCGEADGVRQWPSAEANPKPLVDQARADFAMARNLLSEARRAPQDETVEP
ncbi:MAG: hypothetical protein GYB66_14490 [Chloroflexi bacterium]|nr:hypothetical protein [Chloroflexota bacterium]